VSYLKIKDFKKYNRASNKNNSLEEKTFGFNFERLTCSKKNEKSRTLFFKLGFFFYIFFLNSNQCYNINSWIKNSLLLITIKGKKLEYFWFFLKFFNKDFYPFFLLDNFYQVFLPSTSLVKNPTRSIFEYGYILLFVKFNPIGSLRISSAFLSNRSNRFSKILILFFMTQFSLDINTKRAVLTGILNFCYKLFKKTDSFRWYIGKLKTFNLQKQLFLPGHFIIICKLFFKTSINEKKTTKTILKNRLVFEKRFLNIENHLIFYPKKTLLKEVFKNNNKKQVIYFDKYRPIFHELSAFTEKREIYNNYLYHIPCRTILEMFKNSSLKIGWLFLVFSNKTRILFATYMVKLNISYYIIHFVIKKTRTKVGFSHCSFLSDYLQEKTMFTGIRDKITILSNPIHQKKNFTYFGNKNIILYKNKCLFIKYDFFFNELISKNLVLLDLIDKTLLFSKTGGKLSIVYRMKFFIRILYSFLFNFRLKICFSNYFKSFLRDAIHLRNSSFGDTLTKINNMGNI